MTTDELKLILTIDKFKQLLPYNPFIQQWYAALTKLLPDYDINTPQRIAAFMAECAHESINFTAIKENLNYKADQLIKIWPSHFPTYEIAQQFDHKPEAIANRVYANRMGNGDEASGDGWKYIGRGVIQLTGKYEYQKFADSLSISLGDACTYLETFEGCVQSACFFWEQNELNTIADRGDIVAITKVINPALLGLAEREANYNRYIKELVPQQT